MNCRNDQGPWSVDVAEVSAGVYRVAVSDQAGRSVEKNGTDPDVLILECKRALLKFVAFPESEQDAGDFGMDLPELKANLRYLVEK